MPTDTETHGANVTVAPGLLLDPLDHGLIVGVVAFYSLGGFVGIALVATGIVIAQHSANRVELMKYLGHQNGITVASHDFGRAFNRTGLLENLRIKQDGRIAAFTGRAM